MTVALRAMHLIANGKDWGVTGPLQDCGVTNQFIFGIIDSINAVRALACIIVTIVSHICQLSAADAARDRHFARGL